MQYFLREKLQAAPESLKAPPAFSDCPVRFGFSAQFVFRRRRLPTEAPERQERSGIIIKPTLCICQGFVKRKGNYNNLL